MRKALEHSMMPVDNLSLRIISVIHSLLIRPDNKTMLRSDTANLCCDGVRYGAYQAPLANVYRLYSSSTKLHLQPDVGFSFNSSLLLFFIYSWTEACFSPADAVGAGAEECTDVQFSFFIRFLRSGPTCMRAVGFNVQLNVHTDFILCWSFALKSPIYHQRWCLQWWRSNNKPSNLQCKCQFWHLWLSSRWIPVAWVT